jgi:hypothetical protein
MLEPAEAIASSPSEKAHIWYVPLHQCVALHTFCGPSSKNDGTSNSHDFAKFTS